jgi:hypothetical protein
MPLVVLLNPRAFGLPPLLEFPSPGRQYLVGHDGVVEAIASVFDPSAQSACSANLLPALHVTTKAHCTGQGRIVVRKAACGQLVPGVAPGQDGTAKHLSVGVCHQLRVAQAGDVELVKLEVSQVAISRYR